MTQARKGLEKECLRVTAQGEIAQTPHPEGLGSALTHPYITTDYSEALLELRTPPCTDVAATVAWVDELHRYVYPRIGEELLWATSMPCAIRADDDIPIARYGRSNTGMMKQVYRRGLGYRYGRAMQAIAGVHFNYSLPEGFWPLYQTQEGDRGEGRDFVSACYFALIRNLQRWGWMIPYLFGSSPALSKGFHAARHGHFSELDDATYYAPYATSLRMSDIGYKNSTQARLKISYNSLDEYVAGLSRAIATPYPEYRRIGVRVDGEYRQLNDHVLQIENEYYSFIRPKQIAHLCERPTLALVRRGVQYVEVRALDVAAFEPSGVDLASLRFIELLLLLCLFEDSPPLDDAERASCEHNQSLVATRGREPGLSLHARGGQRLLTDWAEDLCRRMRPIGELLDGAGSEQRYADALRVQCQRIASPAQLPSARMLAQMRERRDSFCRYALNLSHEHARMMRARPLPEARDAELAEAARCSHARQAEIEAADSLTFEEYLRRYFEGH